MLLKTYLTIITFIYSSWFHVPGKEIGYPYKVTQDTQIDISKLLSARQLRVLKKPEQKRQILYYHICPVCHKFDKVVRIVYGYVTIDMVTSEAKGEIKIGGCIVDVTKLYYCKRDYKSF